jgi:hypothetical protein
MFFKKKKWYLITWKFKGDPSICHSAVKAESKAKAWHKHENHYYDALEMIRIEEYEDE